ncbi:hypothetical protein GII36_04365 [Candidatus Mycosynbacter amalyticus]|uniref:DUF2303 family protein n=1 Tax=Candidatus Mycosynbacter amalyticus TaxID=2665156 RepID=A0A857MKI0_9BACT|nr:hypothetical protein [Candidatus Mycosynbacter amalyticus]QHN43063.1 hypothetical protein GII36_04365 [Candidatus Mycosynbacter amalyticus]
MTEFSSQHENLTPQPRRASRRFNLPVDDSTDLRDTLLNASEYVLTIGTPDVVEKSARDVTLRTDHSETDSQFGYAWNKFDSASATFKREYAKAPFADITLTTPQYYDSATLHYEEYGSWTLTLAQDNSPTDIVANHTLLSLLDNKISSNIATTELFSRSFTMNNDEFAEAIVDMLESLASTRTESRVYKATELIYNDAYKSEVTAEIVRAEGPQAVDNIVRMSVSGMPITPRSNPSAPAVLVTSIYEYTYSIPYDTNLIENEQCIFTIQADKPLDEAILQELVSDTDAEARAGDVFRKAIGMVCDKSARLE